MRNVCAISAIPPPYWLALLVDRGFWFIALQCPACFLGVTARPAMQLLDVGFVWGDRNSLDNQLGQVSRDKLTLTFRFFRWACFPFAFWECALDCDLASARIKVLNIQDEFTFKLFVTDLDAEASEPSSSSSSSELDSSGIAFGLKDRSFGSSLLSWVCTGQKKRVSKFMHNQIPSRYFSRLQAEFV